MANSILKVNNTTILDWGDVAGATKYHCRISRDFDFTVIDHENDNLASSIYTAVLTAGNAKYYWQWRSYNTAWGKWNEEQAFEKITGGADLTITDAKWMMFEITERATYTLIFENAPNYSWVPFQDRGEERNLARDLLSEFYDTYALIKLDFGETNSLSASEKNQIIRYYGMNSKDIYLACAPISNNGVDYYRNIWKVNFKNPPEIKPLGGNETRFTMTLELEEK